MSNAAWSRKKRTEPGWYVWAPDTNCKALYLSRLVVTAEGEPLWIGTDHEAGRLLFGPLTFPPIPAEEAK